MYLERCRIRNIKCFEDVALDFRNPDGTVRLWNVLIGENGTGKTTLLQAIAIALLGEKAASVLLPRPRGWVRTDTTKGEIAATFHPGNLDMIVTWADTETSRDQDKPLEVSYEIEPTDASLQDDEAAIRETTADLIREKLRTARRSMPTAWFAAGYGPFRRLGGGTEHASRIGETNTREARFVTLFLEGAALSDGEAWLMDLDYARRDDSDEEQRQRSESLLKLIWETLNDNLLPEGVQLRVITSRGVFFSTPYSDKVRMSDLSDGYRAMLAMMIDLLRQLSQSFKDFLEMWPRLDELSGVVLIDEIDAHLHPTWQREIGLWLKKQFPQMQFIVATHSPFITQAADAGGLYVLRQPDNGTAAVAIHQDEESVRGWRVDQILTSDLFGLETTRSPEVEAQLARYDELLSKQVQGQLTSTEKDELASLEQQLEELLPAPGETIGQRDFYRRLQEYIDKTLEAPRQTYD